MNFTFETQKPAKTTNQDVHSGDYSIESHRIAVNLLAATLERHISVGGEEGGGGLRRPWYLHWDILVLGIIRRWTDPPKDAA